MYHNVSFISGGGERNDTAMSGASLIIWGALEDILCKHVKDKSSLEGWAWRLRRTCFSTVWQDLTEMLKPASL